MFATLSTTEYPAMAAGPQACTSRAQRMPKFASCTSTQRMSGTWAPTSAASILPPQTGVIASVSLFVLLLILSNFLLVGLIGLLSLSCLTGLVLSLVGLLKGLSPGATTGD